MTLKQSDRLLSNGIRTLLAFLLMVVVGACSPEKADKTSSVRLVLLPILETLPLYVAREAGFFQQKGIQVEFIPAASAAERDQLITAGQGDALINDLVSVSLYNRKTPQIQVVRFMRTASATEAVYRIVASPKSGIRTVQDLQGVPIGISEGSVIDYVTDALLQKEGMPFDRISRIAVPKISDRMALLASGELKAATLPEPFSSLAIQQGAVVVLDDRLHPEIGNSVLSFRTTFLDQHGNAAVSFLQAVDMAVGAINTEPEKWRPLLKKFNLVPPAIQDTFVLPVFPGASIPSKQQFDDVISWAIQKGILTDKQDYADSVSAAFLVKQ